MADPIDELIAEVARQQKPGVPLFQTAAQVLAKATDTLDCHARDALQAAGFEAVKREGGPIEILVPDVVELIAAGEEEFDPDKVSEPSLARLTILGFVAIAGRNLMEADRGD